ncbi:cytochrome P450 [Schizophyllum commune H4-8]|uniref:cytochrome P450 n=1 Tax=Schizophyllum commune (strain H4-8 / FGSC 9210) TaxID=578458 RepID=UPI0021606467|nr:cytochrome P450 [Schizophyllum commune H4-8]KAI5897061.1 cytochrome P450 [Schizophyllum commune H4-8]
MPTDIGSVLALLGSAVIVVYVVQRVVDGWMVSKSVGDNAGPRTLTSVSSILAHILPPMPFIPGINHEFVEKFTLFEKYDRDVLTWVAYWPRGRATIDIANAEMIKVASLSKARYPKDLELYSFLKFFGNNIVASEFDEWKFYRRIAAPAFSDRNNALVWDEALHAMESLIVDVWRNGNEVHVSDVQDIALSSALFVFCGAAFGRSISWTESEVIPPGHKMSFKAAVVCASTNMPLYFSTPSWVPGFSENLRRARVAFDELEKYISEMVEERRYPSNKEGRYDLLTRFLQDNDKDASAMDFRGILSNVFVFLVAGHETVAHSICFALALLALHPEEQDKLYEHVSSLYPKDGRHPTYDDMNKFTRTMAVFNETLRMFPPAVSVPKISAQDQVVTGTQLSDGSKISIPCPVGTAVTFSITGLHYNPRYWDSPHEFKPDRFLGEWPKDAFAPFTLGPRACIGRKFAETEGVAILSLLISRYKVEIMEEPQFAGESIRQRRERVLRTKGGVTLTPIGVPLTFRRRD